MRAIIVGLALAINAGGTASAASSEASVTYCADEFPPSKYKNWEELRARCYAAQKHEQEKTEGLAASQRAQGNNKSYCWNEPTFEAQQYCFKYR